MLRNLFVIFSLIIYGFASMNETALCGSLLSSKFFPTPPVGDHTPWIWEAVLNDETQEVEVTTILSSACEFNHSQWRELIRAYPQISTQLADGKASNVLVSQKSKVDGTLFKAMSKASCMFYHNGHIVSTLKSLQLTQSPSFSRLGTFQVRCPVPVSTTNRAAQWDSLAIAVSLKPTSRPGLHSNPSDALISSRVSVCQSTTGPAKRPLTTKPYQLAVCTATSRRSRDNLVEWLEYHFLLGVNHVFMYDTSSPVAESGLASILADYVAEGKLTVVPWHFENCVAGMASGRHVGYRQDGDPGSLRFFKPPPAIAQSAALASCYTRFKRLTRYMLHIDDDEFISLNKMMMRKGRVSQLSARGPLVRLADSLFASHPDAPAIQFLPVAYIPCDSKHHPIDIATATEADHLPRIGRWKSYSPQFEHESKLLMRTDAVAMFYIHYITSLEFRQDTIADSWRLQDILRLPTHRAATLHFKIPPQWSGSVYGGMLSGNGAVASEQGRLAECQRSGFLRDDPDAWSDSRTGRGKSAIEAQKGSMNRTGDWKGAIAIDDSLVRMLASRVSGRQGTRGGQ